MRSLPQEFLNCCLGYVLSQPVDIDLVTACYLLLQYFGVIKVMQLLSPSKKAAA